MNKINFKQKGITLIALVITIIILLILAGITIGIATNGTGLFEKAKEARDKWQNTQNDEETQLSKYINEIDDYVSGTRDSNSNNYSNKEQEIGTWINGKKIYRKVFNPYTNGALNEGYTPRDGLLYGFDVIENGEIELIIDSRLINVRNDGYIDVCNSCIDHAGGQALTVDVVNKGVYIWLADEKDVYIILDYTKVGTPKTP